MIGMNGIGGVGKIFVTKAIYNFLSFLTNVREVFLDKIWSKKVFVVLDDVDDLNLLEFLAGNHDWFKVLPLWFKINK